MAAIGPGWAEDAWIEAAWASGAWGVAAEVEETLPAGGFGFGPEDERDYLKRKYRDRFEEGQRREEEADRLPEIKEPEIVTGIVERPAPAPPAPRSAAMQAALDLSASRINVNIDLSRRKRAKHRRDEDDRFILLM